MVARKIYKYCNFNKNEQGLVYSLDALSNNYVYASYPAMFNDPFDCAVQAELDLTPSVLTTYYQSRETPKEEIEMRLACYFDEGGHLTKAGYEEQDLIRHQISSINKRLGVTCFSKQPYNPLMWAHYSNNHNGFCLEFDVAEPFESKRIESGKGLHIWGKVEYAKSGSLPKVALSDFLSGNLNTLKLILQKGGRWKYEEEQRLIVFVSDDEGRKVIFPPKLLTGIYYGINIDDKLRADIESIIDSKYPHVEEYDLKVSDQFYWLEKDLARRKHVRQQEIL